MARWLHIRLCAPLTAYGGVAIDQVGPTRDLPAASALTGLLANAMGWHWRERDRHQALQDRLIHGALATRAGRGLTDIQNAQLRKSDKAWMTLGVPAGRDGASYAAPHRRSRDYIADGEVRVVLRLSPADTAPDLDDLARALDHPARPLFIGRKPCLPSAPLNAGWIEADTALDALRGLAHLIEPGGGAAIWPEGEGDAGAFQSRADLRNWHTGVHAGGRRVARGTLQ